MLKFGIILACALVAFTVAQVVTVASTVPYRFIRSGHPINILRAGGGQWLYYYEGGNVKKLADNARKDLSTQGFLEDNLHRPWFHFSNGQREVIICEHSEIMTVYDPKVGTYFRIAPAIPYPKTYNPKDHAVVWVRDKPWSGFKVLCFKIKKTVLLW